MDRIFEIGGQEAKYASLTNSVASDYAMNEGRPRHRSSEISAASAVVAGGEKLRRSL